MPTAPATYTDFSTPRAASGSASAAAAQQKADEATYSRLPKAPGATPPLTPAAPAPANPAITPTQPVPAAPAYNETNDRNNQIMARETEFSALNSEYSSRVAAATKSDEEAGAKDLARANTISAMTGMAGGVDATSRAGQVEAKTRSQIQRDTDAINSEKEGRIAGIYSQIDQNVQRAKDAANAKDATDRAKLVDTMNQSAQANIMKFATEGIPWDKAFQDPEFQAEVGRSGKTAFEVQTLYNGSLPKNMQPSTIFSGFKGNNFVQIMQNSDGSVTNHTYSAKELGIPNTVEDLGTVTLGNDVYWYDKKAPLNSDGTPKLIKVGAKSTADTKPKTSGSLSYTQADLGHFQQALQSGATINGTKYNPQGSDGYVDPDLYEALYQKWTSSGGLGKDFITEFPPTKYVNPKAPNLPTYLRNGTKESTSGGA